jgi:nucleotide-binding universal stress UspA family protein
MSEIQSILVPVDFSEHSKRAAECALGIAQHTGAKVLFLHSLYLAVEIRPDAAWWKERRAQATQALQVFLDLAEAASVDAESQLTDGLPSEAILQTARDADLIVIGTRGMSGLLHGVLGSVAQRTIEQAPCPVITVKDPGD